MTVIEKEDRFVVDGADYVFSNFIERNVQGRLIQEKLPPFVFFSEIESWPVKNCGGVLEILSSIGFEVVDGKWTHKIQEFDGYLLYHGTKYPFRNAAEKQIQRDLASNGYKPLNWKRFTADAPNGVISLRGPNGHTAMWLDNPLYFASAFQYIGANSDGTVFSDPYFPGDL
jgi:hypothetical protein